MPLSPIARGRRIARKPAFSGVGVLLPVTRAFLGLPPDDLHGSDYLLSPAEARQVVADGRAHDHVRASSYRGAFAS